MHLIDDLKRAVERLLNEALDGGEIDAALLEYPEDPVNGDIAFPCFSLAALRKASPAAIAADLALKISPSGFIAKVEAKGPYLNFFADKDRVLEKAVEQALAGGGEYGAHRAAKREKIMVEYVSPNNNKPLHLGHVRNGLIGSAISSLLESQGHHVVRALLLNDRGLAIAKVMTAYEKWSEGKTPADVGQKGDHFVGGLYVLYEKNAKTDPELEMAAHEMIRKWEAGDEATVKLWKMIGDWAEAGQHETYKKLGFRFDVSYKESDIYKEGKEIVEYGLKKGVFKKDETGAVYAELEPLGLPNKVVLRADGTALYVTQDLFLAKKKFDEEGLEASIYVVGNEQNLHFRQLFKILELLGYSWASKLKHLSYGYVTLPEGRMKSREGTVVDADDLIAELETDAAVEIRQRHPAIPDDELVRRAHQVAMAAIKFHFLEVDIATDMVYDPKASLSFTGRTGPYVQYMHARIRSILRKSEAGDESNVKGQMSNASHEEHALAMLIAKYPETIRQAAETLRPSLVALHLYETAKAFAAFYERLPVLNASPEDRARRLKLAEAVGTILKNGLSMLGIEAPEEM